MAFFNLWGDVIDYNGSDYVLPLVSSVDTVLFHLSVLICLPSLSLSISHTCHLHTHRLAHERKLTCALTGIHISFCVARTYTFMSHTRRVLQFIRLREERGRLEMEKLGGDRLCHQPLRSNFHSASFPLALWLSKRLLDM